MTDSPISFPGLFGDWQFTASSAALHIGSRSIYWYGILITLGPCAGAGTLHAPEGEIRHQRG